MEETRPRGSLTGRENGGCKGREVGAKTWSMGTRGFNLYLGAWGLRGSIYMNKGRVGRDEIREWRAGWGDGDS